jgi:hypothetical protein
MVDERLLRRFDVLLALLAGWFALSLVVASFALMLFDVAVGVLALGTVVVGGLSYLRPVRTPSDTRVEVP